MRQRSIFAVFGALMAVSMGLPGCTVPPLMHRGGIMVDRWAEVKADDKTVYQGLRSNHIFSRIVIRPDHPTMAEVTCTGSLWAMSRQTGDRVNVDSWFEEVHHLAYEKGAWRIRGHAREAPKALQFGVAPHPFF